MTENNTGKPKKRRKIIKTILIVVGVVLLMILAFVGQRIYMWNYRSSPSDIISFNCSNPYITGRPLISAHRSGAGISPEETLMAFRKCTESSSFSVDFFEFDLHITKDDVLVLLHDSTLDRISDCEAVFGETDVRPENKTYAELRMLNMGAKFRADDGTQPYAELSGDSVPDELRILSLDEVLDYLEEHGKYRYIIEIKNGGDLGYRSTDILYDTLKERDLLGRAVLGTFKEDIAKYADETYPDMKRGAVISEVAEFYFASLFRPDGYKPKFGVMQLPFNLGKSSFWFNLGIARVINYAHEHDIAVQYWTVNNEEDMRYLMSIGADCIITDYPDKAYGIREAEF